MDNYQSLLHQVMTFNPLRPNRTSTPTLSQFGGELVFDLSQGFPLMTTKAINFKAVIAELVTFLAGYTSAAHFRQFGTKIWDENANENKAWLANPHRKGTDDCGPMYGAQFRRQESIKMVDAGPGEADAEGHPLDAYIKDGYTVVGAVNLPSNRTRWFLRKEIDQLQDLINGLIANPYGRGHVVSAWNPGVRKEIALDHCHGFFQCYVRDGYLDLKMYQRSADMFLGVPFNIASYAALVHVLAALTNLKPGIMTHTYGDLHVYENHVDQANAQLTRTPKSLPTLSLSPINSLNDVTTDSFILTNYNPDPALPVPMANN